MALETTVSVVIPCYNQGQYLGRALDSVLNQTHRPEEIIVVDDGSSAPPLPQEVPQCRHSLVRLISQTNSGVSTARNKGALAATCNWVAFLDADDEWLPSFLENSLEAIQRYPDAVAVFSNFVPSGSGRARLDHVPNEPVVLKDYFRFALMNRGSGMWTSAVVIRRAELFRAGGFPVGMTLGQDVDTWMRIAWLGPVVVVPEVGAVYHTETPASAVKRQVSLVVPNLMKTVRHWEQTGRIPSTLRTSSRQWLALHARWDVSRLLRAGKRGEALRFLLQNCSPFPFVGWYVKLLIRALLPGWALRGIRRIIGGIRESA